MQNNFDSEMIEKYRWAGKIRFITFSLLLGFLFSMKALGGYNYLNSALICLVMVEALLNQPYSFLTKNANIYRFQFYQMTVDIIAISWILYYMGGIEAPLITIAYYIIILWAGVVSGSEAAFFATITSSILFSSVVILEHYGLIPSISYFGETIPTAKMYSLLMANIAFIFAFGYFSAYSSGLVRQFERDRFKDSLRQRHKFLTIGHLVSSIVHDAVNFLAAIRGYAVLLMQNAQKSSDSQKSEIEIKNMKQIENLGTKCINLLAKLGQFSQTTDEKNIVANLHKSIDDAISLTQPITRMSDIRIEKEFDQRIKFIKVEENQLQEVFVALILHTLDCANKGDQILIETKYMDENKTVIIKYHDSVKRMREEIDQQLQESFFTNRNLAKTSVIGLSVVREIINRYKGTLKYEISDKGTDFIITFMSQD